MEEATKAEPSDDIIVRRHQPKGASGPTGEAWRRHQPARERWEGRGTERGREQEVGKGRERTAG